MLTAPVQGLSIVAMGGGTGLSSLLSGLKQYVGKETVLTEDGDGARIETLTAVVTVTDDGGSSGRLREEFQILPPGDIRNCMVALAEDEHLLTKLFQYRFESDGHLSGHSFGNLFLTALTGTTGDFLEAVKMTCEVLAIKGRIFPSTTEDVALVAELDDGRTIQGETRIVEARARIKRLSLSCEDCQPLPETLEAIRGADLITIGPGSLYTSLIPNLLVNGIVEAMKNSTALKVYICNIMTQPGETDGFSVEDHLKVLFEYAPDLQLDYVVVNSAPINRLLRDKYLADGAVLVGFRSDPRRDLAGGQEAAVNIEGDTPHSICIICDDLLNEDELVRHDPQKLARLLLKVHRMEKLAALNLY
jgi:uncharacterized cofD-like protein